MEGWSYNPANAARRALDLVRLQVGDIDPGAAVTLLDAEIAAFLEAAGVPLNRDLTDPERLRAIEAAAASCEALAARWEGRPDSNLLTGRDAVRPLTRSGGLRVRARELRAQVAAAATPAPVNPRGAVPPPVFGRRFTAGA